MVFFRNLLIFFLVFLAIDGLCQEQLQNIPQAAQAVIVEDTNKILPLKSATLSTNARVIYAAGVSDKDSLRIRLGDFLKLKILDLSTAMKENGNLRPDQLRLFVDDIVLANVPPYSVDTANGIVVFPMSRNLSSEPFWRVFYQFPRKYEHPGRLGIGSEIAQLADPYPTDGDIKIVLIRRTQLFVGLGLVILFGLLIYWLSRHYRLIKEDWSNQYNPSTNDVSDVPYSLSKVQLAFWTFLAISGYFIIWLVTGELPTIPESILALLGISLSGTILGKGINFRQSQKNTSRVQDKPSKGFFWDILSDENGLSLARLQFVLFNLIIGASLIRNIIKSWSLLDLDASSLVLLTISGAGYLVMKNTENTNPTTTTTTTTTTTSNPTINNTQTGNDPALVTPVTPQGGVISRQEEDNSVPAPAGTVINNTPPSSNRALG